VHAVTDRLSAQDGAYTSATRVFEIDCECLRPSCTRLLEIRPDQYVALRVEASHFAVHPEHVAPEHDRIVHELVRFVVIEDVRPGPRPPPATDVQTARRRPHEVEAERRRWLERLLDACDRIARETPDSDDRYLDTRLADLGRLRARIDAELRAA
jgi:hypothetical protein